MQTIHRCRKITTLLVEDKAIYNRCGLTCVAAGTQSGAVRILTGVVTRRAEELLCTVNDGLESTHAENVDTILLTAVVSKKWPSCILLLR